MVLDWPTPKDRKQLQRFLWFANFYCNSSKTIARSWPLCMLSPQSKPGFCGTTKLRPPLPSLEECLLLLLFFILLTLTNRSSWKWIASDTVGAVLGQRFSDGKIHPCVFFSRSLTAAEHNYDVGEWEMLAIKMALEEWRDSIEGAKGSFRVWTDHRNLEYINTVRRINPM